MATAICRCLVVVVAAGVALMAAATVEAQPNYADALTKSILFFEGQRSGKLPSNQRMTWRGDSALRDGVDVHVDLVGGYYDAGDNVKFNFPMAFTTTMLAWSLLDFGQFMGASDRGYAVDALRWGTDYLLKATSIPGCVFVQVGNPYSDHDCWERPEDMDTLRTSYAVTKNNPGSEVSAEIAAALAASSMVFQAFDRPYAARLRNRAVTVFDFADKYRGSFNTSLGHWVCPFYCDFSGYQDELIWGALWLHRSTRASYYWNYVSNNIQNLEPSTGGTSYQGGSYTEFGWDSKHAGIYVLIDKLAAKNPTYYSSPASAYAEKFICTLLPESPTRFASFSPGGLMFKSGGSNLQHATALSFLMLVYARQLSHAKSVVHCGNVVATPRRIARLAQSQVDYILGSNPLNMSYMVGYGNKFPLHIHHRGSSLPSVINNPQQLSCQGGSPYFTSPNPNPNLLVGAVVGGPSNDDSYQDSRYNFVQSEPTTYINAPFVGVLAFFKAHHM